MQLGSDPIAAVLITKAARKGWDDALARWDGPKAVLFHDCEEVPVPGAAAASVSGIGDFGMIHEAAVYLAREYPFLWFFHDDTEWDGVAPRTIMAQMLSSGAVLAFPGIDGPDASWQQQIEARGISDAVSFCSQSAFMVRADFARAHRIGCELPCGMAAMHYQLAARSSRARAIVVHSCRTKHRYSGTYDMEIGREERRRLLFDGVSAIGRFHGHPADGWGRTKLPTPVQDGEGTTEMAFEGGAFTWPRGRAYANPNWSDARNCAEMSPTNKWTLRGTEDRRYQVGDGHRAVSEPNTVAVTVQANIGLGDVVFVCRMIRAVKEAYPHIRFSGTSQGGYGRLLAWCLDLEHWAGAPFTPESSLETGSWANWGGENVPDSMTRHFGVEYQGQPSRISVPEEKRAEMEARAKAAGWDGRPMIAAVASGGWPSKQWLYTRQFVLQASNRGYAVWCPGALLPGSLNIPTPDFMDAAAMLPNLAALVGFDSGLTHIAADLGVPTVALTGNTSGEGTVLSCRVPNTRAIETRNPWNGDCGPNHCRARCSGAACPLRNMAPGADCIDEIPTWKVWEVLESII